MRTDLEKSIRDRIRNISKIQSIPSAVLWQNLVLERILVRIAKTKYHPNFVLKGGILLTRYFPFHRSTQDLDFSIRKKELRNSIGEIFQEIFAINLNDGFSFYDMKLKKLIHQEFSGIRVDTSASFGKSKSKVLIDLGFEDLVAPVEWEFPLLSCSKGALFESTVELNCYPLEFIFAEKLQIAFSKGEQNSRMKDFHDLLVMSRNENKFNRESLFQVIHNVFHHRQTPLKIPLYFEENAMQTFQQQWHAYRNKIPLSTTPLPSQFADLLEEINLWLQKRSAVSS